MPNVNTLIWHSICYVGFEIVLIQFYKQIVSIIHVSLQWIVVWFQTTIWFYKYVYMHTLTVYLVLLLYCIKIKMFMSTCAKCLCQDMPNVYVNMCQMSVLRYAKCMCQHISKLLNVINVLWIEHETDLVC
jgi:hypothetical protein